MNKTKIEWTHRPQTPGRGMTWNPIHFKRDDGGSIKTGNMCTRISPGCKNCYASTLNQRWGNRLEFVAENLGKGHFYLDEKELQAPLRQKKPCTIFVGDMFDLFHEAIPDAMIDDVIAVTQAADGHVYQLLTKRAARLQDYMLHVSADRLRKDWIPADGMLHPWPFRNLWSGVSVESQKYADERITLLLQTPAAVRFLSVEPQLEAVDLEFIGPPGSTRSALGCRPCAWKQENATTQSGPHTDGQPKVDWVICGGESGPGARPFNLAWAESLREQCKAAGVSFFCKQLGSYPYDGTKSVGRVDGGTFYERLKLRDRKGGDPSEWPESLRVREFPA